MITFIIATRNLHKVAEIRAILGAGCRYLSLADLPNAPTTVEDQPTFAGNATKKAVELARWLSSGLSGSLRTKDLEDHYVLADDSGLEVDALNGAPGVHSARFAALDAGGLANAPDAANNEKLLRLLKSIRRERRTARFRCVIALTPLLAGAARNQSPVCAADEFELQTRVFDGVCEGWIEFVPRGTGGFGYDSLFIPAGFGQSFAELGEEIKNRLSHRAQALGVLKASLEME